MTKKMALMIGFAKGIGIIFLGLAFYFKSIDKAYSIMSAILGFTIYLTSMILMFVARRKMRQEREAKEALGQEGE